MRKQCNVAKDILCDTQYISISDTISPLIKITILDYYPWIYKFTNDDMNHN
jgi:hypothetical protein